MSELKQKLTEYDCEVCDRECDVLYEGELPLCSGCFGEVLRL